MWRKATRNNGVAPYGLELGGRYALLGPGGHTNPGGVMLQRIGPRQKECLLRAARCRQLAQLKTDPDERVEYFALEKIWLRLADSYQFSETLNQFVKNAQRGREWD